MNRSEALAPLTKGESRFPIEAGALVRGQIRKLLLKHMLDYYEEKSFIESTFIVRGPVDKVMAVRRHLELLGD